MTLPTFIMAGVQKSGTTSICNYLNQHPQVYMSPVKEPNFLERDWEQFYAEGNPRCEKRIDTFAKYQNLFKGVTSEVAIGEASLNCLFHHEKSIPQIKKYVPDSQIILILRDPVERAYSDYLMHIRDCINPDKTDSFSYQIHERASQSFIIRKGFYYDGIKNFREAFGIDRVSIFLYDDFIKSSVRFLQNVYCLIGVDPSFEPDVRKKAQTAQVPKNQVANKFLRTQNPIRSTVASGLRLVMPMESRQRLRDALIRFNSSDKSAAPLNPEDRSALIKLYREDILNLQNLLQRDLSAWLHE